MICNLLAQADTILVVLFCTKGTNQSAEQHDANITHVSSTLLHTSTQNLFGMASVNFSRKA